MAASNATITTTTSVIVVIIATRKKAEFSQAATTLVPLTVSCHFVRAVLERYQYIQRYDTNAKNNYRRDRICPTFILLFFLVSGCVHRKWCP